MSETQTTVEVDLPVSAATAWELVTDAEALGEWLEADVDFLPEVGAEGTIRFAAEGDRVERAPDPTADTTPDPTVVFVATPGATPDPTPDPTIVFVEEVVPGERLVFRWASSSRPPTSVEIVLTPIELADCIGTHVTITERLVPQGCVARGATCRASLIGAR